LAFTAHRRLTPLPVTEVAIVGRPNVGKSSIFNWLAGQRIAIVDPTSGVTRDRLTAIIEVDGRFVEITDTGGMGFGHADDLAKQIERQIDLAIEQAQVILFVVDAKAGVTKLDQQVAKRLRYVNKPIICVANKCDEPRVDLQANEFYKLGRGKLVCVSALQNRNKPELLRMIVERMPPATDDTPPSNAEMKLAIVGRRNVGKSTFINVLAQAERVIVSEIPGTTRDAVDVRFELDGKTFVAIDTAGVRKKKSIEDDIEFYSMNRAERSIRRADVVLLFLDPTQGISKIEKQLAASIAGQHKPCVLVVNKWDLMLPMATSKYSNIVYDQIRAIPFAPSVFITAAQGKNVKALLNLAQNLFKQSCIRVPTGELNRVVNEACKANPPPVRQNRQGRVYYSTQIGTCPPTIVLFCNSPHLFDAPYQRFLLTTLHEKLPFQEVPLKLYLRRHHGQQGPPAKLTTEPMDEPTAQLS
jgi:GTP-binding protein